MLTLTDGEGRGGLGEAAPLANFTPESVDEAELAIHRWADDGAMPAGSPTARAAIDSALLDLAARAASRPVHDLLAPGSSGIVPVSAFVGGDTTDDLATAAAEAPSAEGGLVERCCSLARHTGPRHRQKHSAAADEAPSAGSTPVERAAKWFA